MLGVGAVQREIPLLQALTRTDTGATTTIQMYLEIVYPKRLKK